MKSTLLEFWLSVMKKIMKVPVKVSSSAILPFCQLQMKEVNGIKPLVPVSLQKDSKQHSLLSRKELKPHLGHLLPSDTEVLDKFINAAGIASSLSNFQGLVLTKQFS